MKRRTGIAGTLLLAATLFAGCAAPGDVPQMAPMPDDQLMGTDAGLIPEGTADADAATSDDAFTADRPESSPFLSESEPGVESALWLREVQVSTHDGFDRVVFELAGEGVPGWRVEYVPNAVDDGSGFDVDVAGDYILQVRISGMTFPPDVDGEPPLMRTTPVGGVAITEVAQRSWFEGYSTAFIGVTDALRAFEVSALTVPTRLVIDVAH